MGIRTLQHYLKDKVIGVTRVMISDFLNKHSDLKDITRRPPTKTRARDKQKEGVTDFILKRYPNTIGTDLVQITKKTFPPGYKGLTGNYIMVSVHKQTGFVWTKLLNDSKAKNTLPEIQRVVADCKKKFGSHGLHIESDSGTEYFSVFEKWLEKEDIHQTRIRLVSYVENANSRVQRAMKFLSYDHPIAKNLDLATKKLNNTMNRMTGKAPIEWVGKHNRTVDRVHKGNKSLGHRTWQGKRHKKKTFKAKLNWSQKQKKYIPSGHKPDMVNHLVKRVARNKGVLYKSYQDGNWSVSKPILKKKSGKYWIEDKVTKKQLAIEAAGGAKKKRKGWWYGPEDLKLAHTEVKKPVMKVKIAPVAPKRKLRSEKGEIWKGLKQDKGWKLDKPKYKAAKYVPAKKKKKKINPYKKPVGGPSRLRGRNVKVTESYKPHFGVGDGSLASFLGL